MRGRFVSLEGGEGVGKSTQARMLATALESRGHDVLLTREPGGTDGAEAIRALLLDPTGPDWTPQAEALLFAAARAEHVARAIRPALEAGRWVVCDRFLDSSIAYQGGEGDLTEADIRDLHRVGSAAMLPDLTILLEAHSATSAARLAERDGAHSDRIGGRDEAFHARVRERFASLADREPARYARISAEGAPDEVHSRILAAVEALEPAS